MKKQIFSILAIGVLGLVGCGSGDGTSTVTSINPKTGEKITEEIDTKTGIKLDYLTITPTINGFNFKYNNHSHSKLMYQTKSIYNKTEQKNLDIAFEDLNSTVICEESTTSSTTTAIAYECEPENQVSQRIYHRIYKFLLDENVKFFSSKNSDRILATIKYHSKTEKIEIVK